MGFLKCHAIQKICLHLTNFASKYWDLYTIFYVHPCMHNCFTLKIQISQARDKDDRPFSRLRIARFSIATPIQLPILKYPLYFALGLKELWLTQIYQPLEDSFILSLLSWNPLESLELFHLMNGVHLSIISANALIEVRSYYTKLSTMPRSNTQS